MSILARGHIDVYEARGEYQLLVEAIEPQGAERCICVRSSSRRNWRWRALLIRPARAMPKAAARIGVGDITAPARVIQDMLQILARRFPGLHVRIFPALVQVTDR